LIQTNGYSIECIFKKKLKKASPNIDKVQNTLTLKEFTEEIKNDKVFV
jgi:hypothetical protein